MLGYEEIDELLHALMDAFEGGPALTVGEEEVQPYELIAKLHELIDAAQEDVVKVGRVLSAKNEGLIRQGHDALPELADVLAQVLAAVEVEGGAEKRGATISEDAVAGQPLQECVWLIKVEVLDSEGGERIEKGEFGGLSIDGRANRVKMEEAP